MPLFLRQLLHCLALATMLAACERRPPAAAAPVPDSPRIVVLSPAVGVIVRDLGLSHQCVARHAWDMVLPKSLPVAGDQSGIDYEALLKARPTHVLTQWGSRELPQRLVTLAQSGGWKLHDSRLLSLDDIRQTTSELGAMLAPGSPRAAELLASMDAAWSRRGEGFAKLGSVLLLGAVSPPSAFGPPSCHAQVLERIGAVPAITSGAAYIELDAEAIIKLAPGVIVLIAPRGTDAGPSAQPAATQLGAIATLPTPAAEHARFAVIDHPLAFLPSTAMVQFADELARQLEDMKR